MKEFLKNTLASALGLFLALGVMNAMLIVFVVGAIAGSSQSTDVDDNSILSISLSGTLEEQAAEDPLSELMGDDNATVGLSDLCRAIKMAKDMDEIKAIYLQAGGMGADPASMQELRKCLLDFKKSGKPVIAYADQYSQRDYYLCSVADKVMLNPSGHVEWKGLCAEHMFFTKLMAKLGVKMQVFKVGTFKSAVEPFINTEMSAANREQVESYLGSIWGNFVKEVAESRNISADSLQAYADRFTMFSTAESLVADKMVDSLTYIDGVKAYLKTVAGIKAKDKLNLVGASDILATDSKDYTKKGNQVAVYYAFGDIVDKAPRTPGACICPDNVVPDLEALENDDNVKAVVLRINSGGGSAYASEQLWHALKNLGKKKPLVISMGGLAASGGYYMSSAGQYIFAEPTTLTGSIGIFGMVPDASELITGKIGLAYDHVKTNQMGDFGTMSRPMNEAEGAKLQMFVERGYDLFLSRVAEGRNKTKEQVDSIGQGRVWTGEQGLAIGLVDKLGTLDDAIAYAAAKAELKEGKFVTAEYPAAEPWYVSLLNKDKQGYLESELRAALGDYYAPLNYLRQFNSNSCIQARMPYTVTIR